MGSEVSQSQIVGSSQAAEQELKVVAGLELEGGWCLLEKM